MSRYLVYTAPGGGHLYPLVRTVEELRERGHQVVVYAEERSLPLLRAAGVPAEAIDPAIEAREDDTWRARTPVTALRRSVRMYLDRAPHEVRDIRAALARHTPDGVLVDNNCWGAAAALHGSGVRWAQAATFLLPLVTPDAPPFGLGLKPSGGRLARVRDAVLRRCALPVFDRLLPPINALRRDLGAPPVAHVPDLYVQAPLVLSYTAPPLEYPGRELPPAVRMVGPGDWDPAAGQPAPDWLAGLGRPVVLVTCSSQFQDDAKLVEVALDALADAPYDVVVTTASIGPERFRPPPNAHLQQFLPHSVVLPYAAAVVCHGGMGITQKALLAGVPVCVVPFGRDQLEVARRVDVAGAGTRLPAVLLSRRRLRAAVERTVARRAGAQRAGRMLAAAGGAPAAAAALEELTRDGARTA
ncbi:MAG: glycosyltransferase [Mycobacteriales bacterium]